MAAQTVLAVFAHADDEVLFGWPYLQNPLLERHLILCSREKPDSMFQQCQDENINLVGVLNYGTGFHEEKDAGRAIDDAVTRAVKHIKPDFIVTHNPWGEYGHPDHIRVGAILHNIFGPGNFVRSADIIARSTVWNLPTIDLEHQIVDRVKLDESFFDRGRTVYKRSGHWTTNHYLADINMEHVRNGVTIRSNWHTWQEQARILWICECLGWAWSGRALAMIDRMPQYSHRIMWANHPSKIKGADEDADVVFASHPKMLAGFELMGKIVPILSSMRSFQVD